MKNKKIICLLAILMIPMASFSQWRQVNVVGTVGMATGNTQRLIVNLGVEMEVLRHFFAQVSFDNFIDWNSLTGHYSSRDGQISLVPAVRTRVFGINLLGSFKLPLTQRSAWFAKAGFAFSFHSRDSYDNYYYDDFGYYGDDSDYYSRSYLHADESQARTGLAYALGTGIEYRLSDKLAVIGGGIYESLFDQTSSAWEEGKNGDWVKLYVGFSYRLR
jgi:hypothetical protein